MAFNAAQYEEISKKLTSGIETLSNKLNQVGPKAESTANHWYVPDFVADAIIWTANKLIEAGSWILNKIKELLQGIAAPVYMAIHVWDWQSDVRGKASGVAGSTTSDQLQSLKHWTGDAATAYTTAVKAQPIAAAKVGTSADKVATGLALCATAGLAFYVALGVVLYQLIASMIAAIVALGSLVFSWAGAALVVAETTASTAAIITATTALLALLGAQAQQMSAIEGEARDESTYPHGHWPVAAP
ncbi:hypothetical protein OG369_14655 [Streptomyces sp. NBC_01221]|uniref:hypothetical protein n=1 Tax=Streptomyces sp. NBC_01221 TaxID=2903782 RepID=UPI002252E7B2|nr:hypothetical protein [Streptomyces sp. NBC_01221]MCX4787379.1 hypothetical protein [Streptomyces sp. NBC_01221]